MQTLYYRTAVLESIARKVLTQYDPFYLNQNPQAVPIERIIEDVFSLDIDYMRLTESGNELGRMVYDNGYTTRFNVEKDNYELVRVKAGKMIIEALLLEAPKLYARYRFTLAHELAHWILHKKLFAGTCVAAASYETDSHAGDSVEWQANHLAQAILMPAGQIKRGFHQMMRAKGAQKSITENLAALFEVSYQAMSIRLTEFGLVEG